MQDKTRQFGTHGPSFESPPVSEVVCGVQFSDLEGWSTVHFGGFWSDVSDRYPKSEDHPPVARVSLDTLPEFQPQFSILPPLRRVFFVDQVGNYLIQVQNNRLLHNWRKVKDDDIYPRFPVAYSKFKSAWLDFNRFLDSAKLAPPKLDFYELTYVNHITEQGAEFPRDIWEFLGFYEKSPNAITAMDASGMAMQFIWPLEGKSGSLTLDVKHGRRALNQQDVLLAELTARGSVSAQSENMDDWFALAHHAIVNTFEKFTTERGHKLWRRAL